MASARVLAKVKEVTAQATTSSRCRASKCRASKCKANRCKASRCRACRCFRGSKWQDNRCPGHRCRDRDSRCRARARARVRGKVRAMGTAKATTRARVKSKVRAKSRPMAKARPMAKVRGTHKATANMKPWLWLLAWAALDVKGRVRARCRATVWMSNHWAVYRVFTKAWLLPHVGNRCRHRRRCRESWTGFSSVPALRCRSAQLTPGRRPSGLPTVSFWATRSPPRQPR
mmetsp:Transcript_31407/g.68808  ORF Transcript_31407/g.68808 Transcript_31407/m.68808 type:complete len:230 (-) Transcript_31407:564-1253(-)